MEAHKTDPLLCRKLLELTQTLLRSRDAERIKTEAAALMVVATREDNARAMEIAALAGRAGNVLALSGELEANLMLWKAYQSAREASTCACAALRDTQPRSILDQSEHVKSLLEFSGVPPIEDEHPAVQRALRALTGGSV